MKKKFLMLLVFVVAFAFASLNANAELLRCAVLVNSTTGSKVYIGYDGKEITGDYAYETLRSQCAWHTAGDLCKKHLTKSTEEPIYGNYPTYAPQWHPGLANHHQDCAKSDKAYSAGGCYASALISARAVWETVNPKEIDLSTLNPDQKNQLIQMISQSPHHTNTYVDAASGQERGVDWVDNLVYIDGALDKSGPFNYIKFVTNQIDEICNEVKAHGYSGYASGYIMTGTKRFIKDTVTVEHNVSSMTLAQVQNSVSGNGGLLLSVKSPCPFTTNTHFITIMDYDASKGYLVIHGSKGAGGQYPSGWYDDSVISKCISGSGINNGIWSLHPDACITTGFVNDGCTCDTATGEYVYSKNENGNITTEKCNPATDKDKCKGFITNHSCPQTCSKTCSNNNGTYTCKDGNTCDEDKYKKECTHTCQTPEESGDGNYYCKESSPGKGDGDVCDKEKYMKQCKCDSIKDKCENNQNPTDPDCEEYNKYCVDCTPNIYMPATCNNFDIDSNEKGVISDIHQSNAGKYSCNSDVPKDMVKSCVINKNDAANNSFNATVSSGIDAGNRYCTVWCKDSYDFNVPTARTTKSGGYFTVSTKLSGTRDCYIAGTESNNYQGIDTIKFRNDIKELTDKMLADYTEYVRWKTALSNITSKQEGADGLTEACECDDDDDDDDAAASSSSGPGSTANITTDASAAITRFIETTPNMDVNLTKVDDGCCCDSYESCKATIYYVQQYSYKTYTAAYNVDGTISHIVEGSSLQSENIVSPDGEAKDASSCGSSGTCHDGSSEVVRGRIQPKVDEYKKAYESDLKEIKNRVKMYNSCTGTVTNSDNELYTEGWKNDMVDWNSKGPKVMMNYNENYLNKQPFDLAATYSSGDSSEMYCFGDTDATYKCVSGGSANSSSNALMDTNIIYCNESSCTTNSVKVGKSKWILKSKTQHASFKPDQDFAVRSQYGTIKLKAPECNGNDCLYTKLPSDALPVMLLTQTGVFPFSLGYYDIGQYGDSASKNVGRILAKGNAKTVVTAYTQKVKDGTYEKCSIANMEQTAGYVCHYLTNCDDCEFKCDPNGQCYFEECDDGNCKFICKDCVFDGDHATYSFRPVSLTNLFPNTTNREVSASYNWMNGYKGKLTREVVEKGRNFGSIKVVGGEEIYDTPEYSYQVTANNLANIRKYNDKAGTFTNEKIHRDYQSKVANKDSIHCSKMIINDLEYSVKCNSSFLDLVKVDKSLGTELKRPDINNRFILFTDILMKDTSFHSVCPTSCNLVNGVETCKSSCINRANAIGPSWK